MKTEEIKKQARKFMASGKTIGGGDAGWIQAAFVEGAKWMQSHITEGLK